ncbi:MAG: response regulator [Candidatus Helarchaeota archaeon]
MNTIFIVEDDSSLRKLYEKLFSMYGFKILGIAKDGEEAIQMFNSFELKPDLILMDHRLPLKDGIKTTKEILDIEKEAKIIFASADKNIRDLAFSVGVSLFIEKPFNIHDLIDNIQKIIN